MLSVYPDTSGQQAPEKVIKQSSKNYLIKSFPFLWSIYKFLKRVLEYEPK